MTTMQIVGALLALVAVALMGWSVVGLFRKPKGERRNQFLLLLGGFCLFVLSGFFQPQPDKHPNSDKPTPSGISISAKREYNSGSAANLERPSEKPTGASSPIVIVDTTLAPVGNIEIRFAAPHMDAGLVRQMVNALAAVVAERGDEMRKAKIDVVNFMVTQDRAGSAPGAPLLHFTAPLAPMIASVSGRSPSGKLLTFTTEAGANSISAEHAVADYCQGAAIAFCRQVVRN